jgi:hypothetical protein
MNPIQLVACDMDGTYLREDRTPHPENKKAIAELVESGVIFCLASGRGIGTMQPALDELGLTGPMVSSNGAFVTDLNGNTILDRTLDPTAAEAILNYAESHLIHVNRYHHNKISFTNEGPFADLYIQRTGCQPAIETYREMRSAVSTKILFIDHPHRIDQFKRDLSQVPALQQATMVTSEPDYLEFLPAGITKGQGLKVLASHLGIPPQNCAAIGDWLNDREMLQWVGFPAAVANAHPEIVALAKIRVATNEQAGVAEFLRAIIRQNQTGIVTL